MSQHRAAMPAAAPASAGQETTQRHIHHQLIPQFPMVQLLSMLLRQPSVPELQQQLGMSQHHAAVPVPAAQPPTQRHLHRQSHPQFPTLHLLGILLRQPTVPELQPQLGMSQHHIAVPAPAAQPTTQHHLHHQPHGHFTTVSLLRGTQSTGPPTPLPHLPLPMTRILQSTIKHGRAHGRCRK